MTDAEATFALAQQEQAIASMSRLLNALFDISKLESGAIRPVPADVAIDELFEELGREFTGLTARKSLTLEVTAARQPHTAIRRCLSNCCATWCRTPSNTSVPAGSH